MKSLGTQASGAILSDDDRFRYRLWRQWDDLHLQANGSCVWLMLNPSTADATKDDATIRKCCGFAKRWGFAGIEVVNLFAFRSRDVKRCRESVDRNGDPDNLDVISTVCTDRVVICAWGVQPWADERIDRVQRLLYRVDAEPMCIGRSKDEYPVHPLMQPYTAQRSPYTFSTKQKAA